MHRYIRNWLVTGLALLVMACGAKAQTAGSGSIQGVVKDPSGAVVAKATVEIDNVVSGYTRTTSSGSDGSFGFTNVPFDTYHMTVTAPGFATYAGDVQVRSAVPSNVQVGLKVGTEVTTVTVESSGAELIENDPTFHTDVDRGLFKNVPLESSTSELSSLVTLTTPGIAADSNGLFHGMGDHASNSFSVDGQPITDQQSKVFSNQLPADAVQSMEVIAGAPPAEYGGKTSLVIVATTRSGLGENQPHGEVFASYGAFGTVNGGFEVGYGTDKLGNFISANGLNTGRFLDGPEFNVFHDKGNEENIFDRVDYKPSTADTLSLNFQYTRSWFQTPNSYDAQFATGWTFNAADPTCPPGQLGNCGGLGPNGQPVGAQDQRSKIQTVNIAPSWTRLINTRTVFTLGGWFRRDGYNYYPSADPFADQTPELQLETVSQYRTLANGGIRASVSYVKGMNNIKAGVDFENTALSEKDHFGIVDPTVNVVCLNAANPLNLLPDTNPTITDPAQCTGTLVPNTGQGPVPAFISLLGCYDLTRTGPLPVSDGCPAGQTTSESYYWSRSTNIKEAALYLQDTITIKNWSVYLGLRGDIYEGISSDGIAEPRLGVAYNIKQTNTVLRFSYARTMETPFNENLILASTGCNDPVIFDLQESVPGGQCVSSNIPPLSPGHRNEYHAGFQQAFGKYLVIDAEYIWKYTQRAFDFSVLGDTPITYPIEWDKSKIPGYAIRLSVPNTHGFTAYVVTSSVAARFFTPQVSGIGATPPTPGGPSVFRIDHDELNNMTANLQYQAPWKKFAPWIGWNWRYDSGLVAGPVPCFGGESCPNGPNGGGPNDLVDVSGLTPDQQAQAGLFCGTVYATVTTPISSSFGPNLCPASEYGGKYVSIPAPGTENDDHNPQRIKPRSLFDLAVGEDNLFHGDRYKWSLRFTVINLTDKEALYNFISTFSGTHYVTPRTESVELGFHF